MSNGYNEILRRMLDRVPENLDKRPSNPIYTGLAPTAAELTQAFISLEIFNEQTYLLTATGDNLDNRASDVSIIRKQATYAIRIAEMIDTDGNPFEPPINSRFSTPNTATIVNFVLIENLGGGRCLLRAETPGTIGNRYQGALLPLFAINNLGAATMIGTQQPAEDTETDDDLRQRAIDRINQKSFGGNVAGYKEITTDIDGVGAVKVFPVWDGGGTVKLSIVDSEYSPATPEFIAIVQETIDPIPHNGEGLGLAPIGHRVTVETPTIISIYITADVVLRYGYIIPQIQAAVNAAIGNYLLGLRKDWADAPALSIFIARINAAIIGIEGVDNVTAITINGNPSDLSLTQTAQLQQLPVFGSVVLSES